MDLPWKPPVNRGDKQVDFVLVAFTIDDRGKLTIDYSSVLEKGGLEHESNGRIMLLPIMLLQSG
ncbi:MAG: hypothetical protein JW951_07020 [Lentisphaerae bacterium]|nr:hypothetical protein [Lentisphaerota bacterium]